MLTTMLSASATADIVRVALHGNDADAMHPQAARCPPYGSEWVPEWYGVYESNDERPPLHLPQPSSSFDRRVYLKSDDANKVLWYTERGFWHFGHPEDIATGAGMIAVESQAATPEQATEGWKVVVYGQVRWQPLACLQVVPAPPRVLHLHGYGPPELRGAHDSTHSWLSHVPVPSIWLREIWPRSSPTEASSSWLSRGWLEAYVGTYESHAEEDEEDALANGLPVYRRRGCEQPCEQLLWYATCMAQRRAGLFTPTLRTPCWVIGPSRLVGQSPPSGASGDGDGDDGGDGKDGGGKGGGGKGGGGVQGAIRLLIESPLPHVTNATWSVLTWPAPGGRPSQRAAWIAAPGIACTANASEVLGFFASMLASRLGGWSLGPAASRLVPVRALGALASGADVLRDAAGNAARRVRAEALWWAQWIGVRGEVGERCDGRPAHSRRHRASLSSRLPLWIASQLDALRWAWGTLQQSHVSLSSVLATCLAWLGLVLLDLWRRRRWPLASDEAEIGELGVADDPQVEGSSEEKKLAFACLSEAIEEVKTSITEQQYLALYSAALWTFNLTPCWAEGRPVPPDRRDVGAAASGAAAADVAAAGAAESRSSQLTVHSSAESRSTAAEAAPAAESLQPPPGPSEPLHPPPGPPRSSEPLLPAPGPSDGPSRRRAQARRTEQPAAEEERSRGRSAEEERSRGRAVEEELVFGTTW